MPWHCDFSVLVLGISVGRKKPSKAIMQKMLHPIVLRLKELQKAGLYRISDGSYEMLRIFLIGVSNDKPANSLVQNQAEPNAMYGCSKCEIAGNRLPHDCTLYGQTSLVPFRTHGASQASSETEPVSKDYHHVCSRVSDANQR